MDFIGKRFRHIRVLSLLGEGAMGSVYAAHDETLDRKVALKALHGDIRLDEDARRRMLREARALSRLDHPNICRIYDYLQEDDTELLVLEYIDGRTLEDLRAGLSRHERLRIALALADVLIAAHRAGIIHRDLKPENVMITHDGTVKVLDFGLSQLYSMRAAESVTRMQAVSSASSSKRSYLVTEAGTTMGTPLYMSPEQARGEKLTPASDMYSLGLLLQTLFTGGEPHPLDIGVREVMLRAARNETEPVRGIDHATTALIEQLKQAAPTDRPTAKETATRLQTIIDRPKRVGRRAAAATLAAILAIGAWRYTVDLAAERTVAVEARKDAERRRAQAEELIDFMLGDLHRSLEPIGKLDVLDKAADRAMAYMSSQQPETMSAGELAHNATALQNLGQVRIGQGKLPEALKAFEQSLSIAGHAVAKAPNDLPVRFTLGQAQFWVGEAHRKMGDTSAALAKMRDYLATSEALVRAAPQNSDYQVELAYGYSNVGSMLETQGDLAGALSHFERCVAIKQARLRTDPTNRRWQADLGQTINKVAYVLQKRGQFDVARQRFEDEQAIYLRLVGEQPDHAPWRNRLVTNRWYLAGLFIDLGALDDADRQLLAAREDAEKLVRLDAANVQWRANLALVLALLGNTERMRGHDRAARPWFDRARTLQQAVVRDAPERKDWRGDLAMMDIWLAMSLHAAGDRRDAASLASNGLAVSQELSRREQIADALVLLGTIDAEQGRTAEAQSRWQAAAETVNEPGTPRLADRRARALLLAGRTGEAQVFLARLEKAHYANPDLASVIDRSRNQRRGAA